MPKNTHDIGKREERQIVRDLEKLGYRARRQPGSGNRAVDLQHDVVWLDSPAGKLHLESKYRRDCAWKVLEKWRAGAGILYLRCDARVAGQDGQAMAYLPWDLLLRLVGEAATRDDLSALQGIDSDPEAEDDWSIEDVMGIEFPTDGTARMVTEQDRRQRIQAAHQNPKPKPAKPRKLQGRGLSKR